MYSNRIIFGMIKNIFESYEKVICMHINGFFESIRIILCFIGQWFKWGYWEEYVLYLIYRMMIITDDFNACTKERRSNRWLDNRGWSFKERVKSESFSTCHRYRILERKKCLSRHFNLTFLFSKSKRRNFKYCL